MTDHLGNVLAALADPTRRAVVERLLHGPATPGELAEDVPMTAQGLSRHLAVLEGAGLIFRTREGQRRPCHIDPSGVAVAASWFDQNRALWESRFARLEKHLAKKGDDKNAG